MNNASVSQEDKVLAFLAHFLGGFVSFLAPLIIWLLKKDQSQYIDEQGKEALNFQISMLIYGFILFLLTLLLIGFILIPIFIVVVWIFIIIASIKTLNGENYRYPFIFRFIK